VVSLVEPDGADAWVSPASLVLRPQWLGAWMVLADAGGAEIGAYRVAAIDAAGRARLEGAAAAPAAVAFSGEYRFDAVDLLHGAGLDSATPVAGGTVAIEGTANLPAGFAATDLTIRAFGTLLPLPGSATIELDVSGTMTVESNARIGGAGFGFKGGDNTKEAGDAPAGLTPAGRYNGGSHGAQGTRGYPSASLLGDVFDSVYQPAYPGGGGGRDGTGQTRWGGNGGGLVILRAETVVLHGEILARGADRDGGAPNNDYAGTGAGGTVVIDVTTLAGGGTIDASGGDYWRGGADYGGVGGGGRVAILAGTLSGFVPASQVEIRGGSRFLSDGVTIDAQGAPGTLYVSTLASTYGDLHVDQGTFVSVAVPPTLLPTTGAGVIGTVAPDAPDSWVEPADPAALFDLGLVGMWLRVGAADYRILAQTSDRRQLLLEGAASAVVGGEAYSGVYKLDLVAVRGGAILELRDAAEVGTYDVDADSTVITP